MKLPTGYGKTITACGSYSILKHHGQVNRALFIFPTVAQLQQFIDDGPVDFYMAGMPNPLPVINVGYFGPQAIKKHRTNQNEIFAITIQSLINGKGGYVADLMQTGKWLVVVDEYHHYGCDAAWGVKVKSLPCQHLLAMSATPFRKKNDGAFGDPDIEVDYRKAVEEKAVKPLSGHSYIYRVSTIDEDGQVSYYTTDQLATMAGGDSPEAIEAMMINKRMRWSPKYISPLVTKPIERMLRDRIATGYQLQVLASAMTVSHAKMICEQIGDLYPELSVDWVGTKPDGRDDEENRKILKRFCPAKDEEGRRNPDLDVLVHVALAGEGLDSRNVSEVVFLHNAAITNTNQQVIGRGARYLEGVTCNVNFDSTSEYAEKRYIGRRMEEGMDDIEIPPGEEAVEEEAKEKSDDYEPLPDEPFVHIWDMELQYIDSGDPEVQRMAKALGEVCADVDSTVLLADLSHPGWKTVEDIYKNMRLKEAERFNEQSKTEQWRESVKHAVSRVTGLFIRTMYGGRDGVDKREIGRVKAAINSQKLKDLKVPVSADIEACKKHYEWLRKIERIVLNTKRVPAWV